MTSGGGRQTRLSFRGWAKGFMMAANFSLRAPRDSCAPRHSSAHPRARFSFGDVRDELGRIDGCTCEPAARGRYSGTILPDCPHHGAEHNPQGEVPPATLQAAPHGIGGCVCHPREKNRPMEALDGA